MKLLKKAILRHFRYYGYQAMRYHKEYEEGILILSKRYNTNAFNYTINIFDKMNLAFSHYKTFKKLVRIKRKKNFK